MLFITCIRPVFAFRICFDRCQFERGASETSSDTDRKLSHTWRDSTKRKLDMTRIHTHAHTQTHTHTHTHTHTRVRTKGILDSETHARALAGGGGRGGGRGRYRSRWKFRRDKYRDPARFRSSQKPRPAFLLSSLFFLSFSFFFFFVYS